MKVLVAISCILAVVSAGFLPHHGIIQHQHLPVIGPNGVPLEPAENVAARAQHASAHIEAKARNGDLAHLGYAHGHVDLAHGHLEHFGLAHAAPLAYAHGAHLHYGGPQHLPVIGPHGVPLEPAANVAARAQHAAAHVEAKARNGDLGIIAPHAHLGYAHGLELAHGHLGLAHGHLGLAHAAPLAYAHGSHLHYGGEHLPVIGPHGVPLEPAENVAARAQHAAAHIEAKARNGDIHLLGRKRRGIYAEHIPVIGPHGVPLEPAANVAARAAHAAAHAEALGHSGHGAHVGLAYAPAHIGYAAAYHPSHTFPALAHDGQPLETPEVVAAKAVHFAAHAEANARNAHVAYDAYDGHHVHGISPLTYHAAPLSHITHNGLPLDTPEVAAAKAAHFAAHAATAHGYHGHYY